MYCRFASLGPVSGSVGTTYSDTGAASAPAVAFTFGSDNVQTPTTDDVGSSRVRTWFGAAVSTSNRVNVAIKSNNGQAAGVCHTILATDAFYDRLNGTSAARQLQLDADAFLSNGFREIVDATGGFGANTPIFMIGGTEVTATIVNFDEPSATGTQDITSSGFGTPDLVIFVWSPHHSVLTPGSVSSTAAAVGWGAATKLDSQNGVWAGYSLNGADPSNTASYCRLGDCVASFSSSAAINARAHATSWITDGVQITWDAVAVTGRHYYAILIKGIGAKINSFTTVTDTSTDIVVSGLGFTPAGGMTFSACKTEDSAGTATAEHKMSLGCYDYTASTITQFAVGNWDEHNLATTSSQGASNYGESYLRLGNADALVGSMNITAIAAGSRTMRMTDADPDAVFGWALDFGELVTSTVAATLAGFTCAATVTETLPATVAATWPDLVCAAAVAETLTSAAAATWPEWTCAASVTVDSPGTVTSTVAATWPELVGAATMAEALSCAVAGSLAGFTCAATVNMAPPVTSDVAATWAGFTAAANVNHDDGTGGQDGGRGSGGRGRGRKRYRGFGAP